MSLFCEKEIQMSCLQRQETPSGLFKKTQSFLLKKKNASAGKLQFVLGFKLIVLFHPPQAECCIKASWWPVIMTLQVGTLLRGLGEEAAPFLPLCLY